MNASYACMLSPGCLNHGDLSWLSGFGSYLLGSYLVVFRVDSLAPPCFPCPYIWTTLVSSLMRSPPSDGRDRSLVLRVGCGCPVSRLRGGRLLSPLRDAP